MQEMLEYVQEEVQLFGSARQSLISKIKQLLEKEKEVMCEFADDYQRNCFQKSADDYFKETFNTKEK